MYINSFKDFSTEYYNTFKESDFPKILRFNKPSKLEFKLHHIIPGSNKIFLKYELNSKQPGENNPYGGDLPEAITIDIGITYKDDQTTKMYITIVGGNRSWWTFSYENKKIKDIEKSEYTLDKKSLNKIITTLNKYSV